MKHQENNEFQQAILAKSSKQCPLIYSQSPKIAEYFTLENTSNNRVHSLLALSLMCRAESADGQMRTLVLSVEDHVNYLDGRWVSLLNMSTYKA